MTATAWAAVVRPEIARTVVGLPSGQRDRGDPIAARLARRLANELDVRAQVCDPLAVGNPTVLGEEKADERLATARGQLKRDILRAGRQPTVVAQQVGLVRPQVTDGTIGYLQRAKQRLGRLRNIGDLSLSNEPRRRPSVSARGIGESRLLHLAEPIP